MKTMLGVAYVAYCMVQIVIYEVTEDWACMIGWINKWAVFRPTQYFQALLDEFAVEVRQETFDNFSDTGSTAAPATTVSGVWQVPSSSGSSGTWSSSATSSASSSVGASTDGSSAWKVMSGGHMDPVPEDEAM